MAEETRTQNLNRDSGSVDGQIGGMYNTCFLFVMVCPLMNT